MNYPNAVFLEGNLGNDPEIRQTSSGRPVCNFRMATNEKFSSGKKHTEWHRVTVWGTAAEQCHKTLKKGSLVSIEGQIRSRVWTDKEGTQRMSFEIHTNSVKFRDPPGYRNDSSQEDIPPVDEELESLAQQAEEIFEEPSFS